MGVFYETKIHFFNILGEPSKTYEEWSVLPKESRAAMLYLTFYNEIMTAWNKTKSFYTPEEDGVSCVLQYLTKNEPLIMQDKNKFSSRYVYRIAFNCLYCICHDIIKDRKRYELETSNIVSSGEDEINLFDDYCGGVQFDYEREVSKRQLWAVIEVLGPEGAKVVDHLINGGSLKRTAKNSKDYKNDTLRDVAVSVEKMSEIVETLKVLLAPFKDEFYK